MKGLQFKDLAFLAGLSMGEDGEADIPRDGFGYTVGDFPNGANGGEGGWVDGWTVRNNFPDINFSDSFESYADASALNGQGDWVARDNAW